MNYQAKLDEYVVADEIRRQREAIDGLLDTIDMSVDDLAQSDSSDDTEEYQKAIVGAVEQIRELLDTPR